MVNDHAFQHEIVAPFMENLLITSLRSGLRLSNAKRVHNLKLEERFVRRQTQLKRRGISADVSYGFLLLDAEILLRRNTYVKKEYSPATPFLKNWDLQNKVFVYQPIQTAALQPASSTESVYEYSSSRWSRGVPRLCN
uniref:Uncharacterized protein n=1 Tax=Ditylenchus dipsaci TaxID=166011 RepID=A0A915DDY1_9BILA